MSKQGKILLGMVSFLPLVFIIIYAIFYYSMFAPSFHESIQQNGPPVFLLGDMNQMQISMALLIITALGLLIYYLIHVMNNRLLDSTDRLTWILIILLANVAAYPIYWYLKIWKRPEQDQHP